MGDTCLTCQVLELATDQQKDRLIRWQERQIDQLLRRLALGEGSPNTSTPSVSLRPVATSATAPSAGSS